MVRRRVQGAREYEVREGVGSRWSGRKVVRSAVRRWVGERESVVPCRRCGRCVLWKEHGVNLTIFSYVHSLPALITDCRSRGVPRDVAVFVATVVTALRSTLLARATMLAPIVASMFLIFRKLT